MKLLALVPALFLAACATTAPLPAGLAAGKFVSMSCADGKTFSVRAAEGGETVRIRALHGSAELDRKADGVYEGEGYRLAASGPAGFNLMHDGKPQGSACKAAA